MGEPVAFINGRLVAQSSAALPLHDAGFVLGATVTDLCRTFRHKLYRWADHLERFTQSCRRTDIVPALKSDELTAQAEELVGHNAVLLEPDQDLALVLFATPGPVGYYLGEEGGLGDGPATFGMHTFPLPFARYRRLVEQGAALVLPEVRQVPAECIDPRVKMRSRMHWWLADRAAQCRERGSMALLLDAEGHVTETAAANVLVVRDGVVLSPPSDRILNGVSRGVAIDLCGRLGIAYEERLLSVMDLVSADEAMLTSTPYCVAGVSRCEGKAIPWPGPVYRRLLEAWNAEVGVDIHGQIMRP